MGFSFYGTAPSMDFKTRQQKIIDYPSKRDTNTLFETQAPVIGTASFQGFGLRPRQFLETVLVATWSAHGAEIPGPGTNCSQELADTYNALMLKRQPTTTFENI